MDKQEEEDCEEKQDEEEGQDESEVNEANASGYLNQASDTSQHHEQETADQKKLELSEGVTCYDDNCKDKKDMRKSDEESLMAGGNLNVRHVHHANNERGPDIHVEKTCENRKDLLKGDGFQACDPENFGPDLMNRNSSEDDERKQTASTGMNELSGMGTEVQEYHEEEQSMNVLKGQGSEGQTETMQSEDICNEGNQHLSGNFEFIEDVDCIENTEEMKSLKNMEVDNEPSTEIIISDNFMEDEDAPTDGSLGKQALNPLFKMTIRFMLSLFFQFHNKYVTVCKTVLDQNNDQHTAVKRILHMGEFSQTGVFIDLWAVRIIVTPIPSEGRVEAFRWSTFVLAGVGLNFHISSRLAREGFLYNIHNYTLCAFCGRYLNLRHLQQGQRHLDLVLEYHRAHCDFHGNIPLDRYGYDLASHVANSGDTQLLCISGMPYPRQGVCTYAQQVHNIGLQNLAPSGSRHNPLNHQLPQPNLVGITPQVQERAVNDGNNGSTREPVVPPSPLVQMRDRENQAGNNGSTDSTREPVALPSHLVQVTDRENQFHATSSSSLTKVRAIVLALVDSSVGSEVLERGFRRPEVEQAIDQLIRRGVRVNVETVVRELRAIGARPT